MKLKAFLIMIIALSLVSCRFADIKSSEVNVGEETFGFEELSVSSFIFITDSGGASMIEISENGDFFGEYHESNMSEGGLEYDSTVRSCTYSGTFSEPVENPDGTYSIKVDAIDTNGEIGKEYIENSIKYVYSKPMGLNEGNVITVIPAGYDISNMPQEFINGVKRGYYFEGNKLPAIGLMFQEEERVYSWIQQRE